VLAGDLRVTVNANGLRHERQKLFPSCAALLFAIIAVVQFMADSGQRHDLSSSVSKLACVVIAGLAWVGFDASRRS
jgi:hypothetical protein